MKSKSTGLTFTERQRQQLSALWSRKGNSEQSVSQQMHAEEQELIREEKMAIAVNSHIQKNNKRKMKMSNDPRTDWQERDRSRELAERARTRLSMSQFRSVNEFLYTHTTQQAVNFMDESSFSAYHTAYSALADHWPLKPIDSVCKRMKHLFPHSGQGRVFADMGCGPKAVIAESFPNATVHSFDLISMDEERITASDLSDVPIPNGICDCVVFSLSLMGRNISDQIREAVRIMKPESGVLLIAEVTSRFRSEETEKQANNRNSKKKKMPAGKDGKPDAKDESAPDMRQEVEAEDMSVDTVDSFVQKCALLGLRLEQKEYLGSSDYFLLLQFVRKGGPQVGSALRSKKAKTTKSVKIGGEDVADMRLKACQYKRR